MQFAALVVAPPRSHERVITGLTLGARGQRVAIKAGATSDQVWVVRSADELANVLPELADKPLLFIRANRHVVGVPLVEPLIPRRDEAGCERSVADRIAVDEQGTYAGAVWATRDSAAELLNALSRDFEAGDETVIDTFERVEVGYRARHPAATKADARAADAWQFELIHKPLDGFLPAHYQRPLARPFTRIFLRLPLTPNMISVLSTLVSLSGCFIAAHESWNMHILGLCLLLFGVILDACDGEVARLRMQESKLGAWLDAIGDDAARIGLILAVGFHLAPQYPDLPVLWVMLGTLALTITSMSLIYWYCIFVLGSSSNQDYEAALGVGNNVEVSDEGRSLGRIIGDIGTTIARRVFIDPAILILGLLHLEWVGFIGLCAGAVVSLLVILPTHFRLMREHRMASAVE